MVSASGQNLVSVFLSFFSFNFFFNLPFSEVMIFQVLVNSVSLAAVKTLNVWRNYYL